jgi:hypothetical protein
VIVDHARRLHQRVADRRADEFESASQQIPVHCVGFGCARRNLRHDSPTVLDWFAADETLHFPQGEECLGVLNGGCDLQAVPHNPSVDEQPLDIARSVASDLLRGAVGFRSKISI